MRWLWLVSLCAAIAAAQTAPIPVKVVVVTMFERGNDTGDDPGEFQFWVEREPLDQTLPFPQGGRNLRMNSKGVLGMVTGVGTAKAAASVMALGLDPRFDLSHAYWLVAGIAGVDPNDASLGSAAWAEWVVDGDLGHEIDAREIPKDWSTGFVPLRRSKPYETPRSAGDASGEAFHLNPALVDWAYQLTRGMKLDDNASMRARREIYQEPNARKAPFVLKGDTISAMTFWHGKLLSQWANDWVAYHTGGKGNYVTCAMEDTGTLQSLTLLSSAGRVDINRVLVLRTASNYDQPYPGMTAAESLAETKLGKYAGFLPALDAAWRVGHAVVDELTSHWDRYRDAMPAAAARSAFGPAFQALVKDAKSRIREIDIDGFKKLQSAGEKFLFVDVREDEEWAAGHAAGALHLSKGILERDIEGKAAAKDQRIVLYCGGGGRSALAADSLRKMGYSNVLSLAGGMGAYKAAGLPVEK